MDFHQIQCVLVGSETTAYVGYSVAYDSLTPLGFRECETGVFALWINATRVLADPLLMASETEEAIGELNAMYPS